MRQSRWIGRYRRTARTNRLDRPTLFRAHSHAVVRGKQSTPAAPAVAVPTPRLRALNQLYGLGSLTLPENGGQPLRRRCFTVPGATRPEFFTTGATTLAQPQQPLMDLTSRQESTNVTMEIKARLLRRTDQKMVLLAHQVKSYLVDADDPADVIACVWSIPETLSPYLTSYGHGLVSQCFSDNVTMQMDVDPSFRYSDSSTDQGGGIILELAGLSLRAAFRARNDDEGDSAWTAPGCFPRHFQLGKEAVFAHFLEALEEFQY